MANIIDTLVNAAKGGYQFLRENPMHYENTQRGGGGFSFDTRPMNEQYKKEEKQKDLVKALTELSTKKDSQSRMGVLAKYPSLMEMVKGPFGQYLFPDPIQEYVTQQLGSGKKTIVGTDRITVDPGTQ